MKSYEDMEYFADSEKLVNVLCQKTQNTNRLFFRILTAYYFSKVASMMRANIKTFDRGLIPINIYAVNLALSGQGKGHSTSIIEESVIDRFRERFTEETMHLVSEQNLVKIANKRATKAATDPDEELARTKKEYDSLGELAFSFDSATTAAVKQMRHKLLMAGAGSMNMEIDEIGSNFTGNIEVLTTFLELFDLGKVKQKLTKNTNENVRNAEIEGRTPTNMMLFGTPSKLMDSGKTEEEFLTMLETGFARRCIFGYQTASGKHGKLTPQEVYDMLTNQDSNDFLDELAERLDDLADSSHFAKNLHMSKDVSLLVIEYRQQCEALAEDLPDHQEIQRAELSHRYFKALKLAGTYAFIAGSSVVTEDHVYNAIKLVEDSGRAFVDLLSQDRDYVKIAKYLATMKHEITHVDLMEDLPAYKGGESRRRELINLATAWGYKHGVVIKRSIADGIEFLSGESIEKTDLDNIRISYGKRITEGYKNDSGKFSEIHKITQAKGIHWVNHHLLDGYRDEDHSIPGCDFVVLDVDEGVHIETAKLLLQDYAYHMHTTKRHQTTENGKKHGDRFRIIMPLSHHVKLDKEDFKEFMDNIFNWLPFKVDTQTGQRSRKWMSHKGQYWDNKGKVLDALMFIPKTRKAEQEADRISELRNLSNLERWFIDRTVSGNRSNNLLRYGMMLVDANRSFTDIDNAVKVLNNKLADPLDEGEINGTIMITVNNAIHKRDSGK